MQDCYVHVLPPPTVMGGLRWKSNVLRTVFFIPGCAFSVFFFLNILLWSSGSSAAIPFTTLIALLALFFGISTPLTVLGSYLGFRKIVSASLLLYMYTVNILCVCVCVCACVCVCVCVSNLYQCGYYCCR